jgi:hypothetical protein
MVTTDIMIQAFFATTNPVDPTQAWKDYISGPCPISDPTAPKWNELSKIANALVDANVAEIVLGIGVEQVRQFVPGSNNGHCPFRPIDHGPS